MKRRQPVAVYRVIDETELFGESTNSSNPGVGSRLHGFDAQLVPPHASAPVRRTLRMAGGHGGLFVALLSVSAVAAVGVSAVGPSVTGRRRHSQVLRTSPPVLHAQPRPAHHTHARPRASAEGLERHRRRRSEAARARASAKAESRGRVHVAGGTVAAASPNRSGGQLAQQADKEFGFER